MRLKPLLLALLVTVLIVPGALAYTTYQDAGTEFTEGLEVSSTLPWMAFNSYTCLCDTHLYKFQVAANQTITANLAVPANGANYSLFQPELLLIGPGLPAPSPDVLTQIQIPTGIGANHYISEGEIVWFEPVTQSMLANRISLQHTFQRNGTYYLGVYAPQKGKYALIMNWDDEYDTFSLQNLLEYDIFSFQDPLQWVLVPLNAIWAKYFFEQSLLIYFIPTALMIVLGAVLCLACGKRMNKKLGQATALASYIIIGSGISQIANFIPQYLISFNLQIIILTIFAAASMVLGFFGVVKARSAFVRRWKGRDNIHLLILGVLGLILWSGFVIGPAMLISVAGAHWIIKKKTH